MDQAGRHGQAARLRSMQKRSVRIAGHATSISLEDDFWVALKAIATEQDTSLNKMIAEIDAGRGEHNLSSALRLFVLHHLQGRGV